MPSSITRTYKDGFKLTKTKLSNIYNRLSSLMDTITDTTTATFKLKYIDGTEVDRPTINSILDEPNSEERTIRTLTINLTGNKNNNKIADISLKFAADPAASITYHLWSDNETWYSNALSVAEDNIKNVKKKFTPSKFVDKDGPILVMYLVPAIAFDSLFYKLFSNYFISSDYVFYWGDYINVLQKRRELRNVLLNVLLVGIILGLIISIAGGIIANYITIKVLKWH